MEQNDKNLNMFREIVATAESAGIQMYGRDFLCRTLAIVYVYGCEDFVVSPVAYTAAMKGQELLEKTVNENDWKTLKLIQDYIKAVEQKDDPDWLESTLWKLNISPKSIEPLKKGASKKWALTAKD